MATFVQLTDVDGTRMLVNLAQVERVENPSPPACEYPSQITFASGRHVTVQESLQMVKALAWEAEERHGTR